MLLHSVLFFLLKPSCRTALVYGVAFKRTPQLRWGFIELTRKLVKLTKNFAHICTYTRDQRNLPVDIRKEHDEIVRKALLSLAVDFDSSLKIWYGFPFNKEGEGTEGVKLLATLEQYLKDLIQAGLNNASAWNLFNTLEDFDWLTDLLFSDMLQKTVSEDDLRALYRLISNKRDIAESIVRGTPHEHKDLTERKQLLVRLSKYLERVLAELDTVCNEQAKEITLEDELLVALGKARNPDLRNTRDTIIDKLQVYWTAQLTQNVSFDEVLNRYRTTSTLKLNSISSAFWSIALEKAETADNFKELMNLSSSRPETREVVTKSWLSKKPPFNEVLEEFENRHAEWTFVALLERIGSFEESLRVISAVETEEDIQRVSIVIASHITTVRQGVRVLDAMRQSRFLKHGRLVVVKATLQLVQSEFELQAIANSLISIWGIQDGEKVALIEKALELIERPQPTNWVAPPSTDWCV